MAENNEIREVFEKEGGRLLEFIKSRIPVIEDAEDLLQEVFYQFVRTYQNMEPIEMVSAWLYKVARNKITDLYRKKKTSSISDIRVNIESSEEEESLSLFDIIPDMSDNPDDVMINNLIMEELENALEDLPEEQKAVFIMHEFEDKSYREIAELTGKPLNTLISRKRYAILYLRERLQQLYNEL
ncbi:RNA polymerase sigma factor [Bacteroidota bacterium]